MEKEKEKEKTVGDYIISGGEFSLATYRLFGRGELKMTGATVLPLALTLALAQLELKLRLASLIAP